MIWRARRYWLCARFLGIRASIPDSLFFNANLAAQRKIGPKGALTAGRYCTFCIRKSNFSYRTFVRPGRSEPMPPRPSSRPSKPAMSQSPNPSRMKGDLERLVAFKTENPPGGESAAAGFLADLLSAEGL